VAPERTVELRGGEMVGDWSLNRRDGFRTARVICITDVRAVAVDRAAYDAAVDDAQVGLVAVARDDRPGCPLDAVELVRAAGVAVDRDEGEVRHGRGHEPRSAGRRGCLDPARADSAESTPHVR